MSAGIKANVDGSAAIQVGGTDVITLTSGGAATFVTSPTTVQAGTAAAPSITFSGDTNTGIYSPGADTVGLTAGGTLVGSVGLGTTLALQGATSQSGTGITFPATQSASSNAKTLDDYEEGTWTPTFGGFGSDPTVTYTSARQGKYTKIGNVVYVSARVALASASGGSGNLVVRGLPFTVANDNLFPACNLGFKTNWTTNGPDYGRFSANTTFIEIFKSNNTNETAITTANLANNTDFIFTGFYYV